jgi:hypothetical protein
MATILPFRRDLSWTPDDPSRQTLDVLEKELDWLSMHGLDAFINYDPYGVGRLNFEMNNFFKPDLRGFEAGQRARKVIFAFDENPTVRGAIRTILGE